MFLWKLGALEHTQLVNESEMDFLLIVTRLVRNVMQFSGCILVPASKLSFEDVNVTIFLFWLWRKSAKLLPLFPARLSCCGDLTTRFLVNIDSNS